MPRSIQYIFGFLIAALLIAGPISYGLYWQTNIRNFHIVRENMLYRSGQLTLVGLKRIVHDYGIKTVISFRDGTHPGEPPPDLQEAKYCQAEEINYFRISPRSWWPPDDTAPAAKGVRKFCAIMDDFRNYPVLIHCWAGIHRTGAFTAIYRMEFEHWTNEEALAELRACGYTNLDDELDILGFLENYCPQWRRNKEPQASISRKVDVGLARHKKRKKGKLRTCRPVKMER